MPTRGFRNRQERLLYERDQEDRLFDRAKNVLYALSRARAHGMLELDLGVTLYKGLDYAPNGGEITESKFLLVHRKFFEFLERIPVKGLAMVMVFEPVRNGCLPDEIKIFLSWPPPETTEETVSEDS